MNKGSIDLQKYRNQFAKDKHFDRKNMELSRHQICATRESRRENVEEHNEINESAKPKKAMQTMREKTAPTKKEKMNCALQTG